MSVANKWAALAARLGTSPRQLALLVMSALAAVGIFGGKLLMAPKSAAAAPVAAPASAPAAAIAATAVATPSEFVGAMPNWHLSSTPIRDPFAQPAEPKPVVASAATTAPTQRVAPTAILQATLDRHYAVIDGRTCRVGHSWIDAKSGQSFLLKSVGERTITLASGSDEYEIHMDLTLNPSP